MANVKGSRSRKRTSSARKSPAKSSGRTTGTIRAKRSTSAYRANTPAARELRSEIDAAVQSGVDLRKGIEDRIERRLPASTSPRAKRK